MGQGNIPCSTSYQIDNKLGVLIPRKADCWVRIRPSWSTPALREVFKYLYYNQTLPQLPVELWNHIVSFLVVFTGV